LSIFTTAQQKKISLGIGTNGLGLSYEIPLGYQFSAGVTANYLGVEGRTISYLLESFIKSDYNINSPIAEGFIKWYPKIPSRKDYGLYKNKLFVKGGLAYNFNPSYSLLSTFWEKTFVGDFELTDDQVGNVDIIVTTQKIQPMVSIGYSFVQGKRIFVNAEIGTYFHGKPNVDVTATGILHNNDVNQPSLQKTISPYQFYPILKLETGICF
jgi:hypothetical protein